MDWNDAGIPILQPRAWAGTVTVFGSAYLMGAAFLPSARIRPGIDRFLLRLACGLALLPVLVLGVGQIPGLLLRFPWWIAGIAGGVLLVVQFRAGVRELIPAGPPYLVTRSAEERIDLVLMGAGWFAVILTLGMMLGPAFSPPINYDVLEYHLGVIPQYFETGRIEPIPHVFYSAQPIATEMLYALGAAVERTPWGLSSGPIYWGLFIVAIALLARILARIELPRVLIPWVLLVLLAHPIIFRLELDRLTDLTGAVFLMGGLLALLVHKQDEESFYPIRAAAIMGIAAGGAISSKWTNAGTVAVPLGIALGAVLLSSPSRRRAMFPIGGFIAGAVLILIPWMLWIWRETGNPIAPFGAQFFPSPAWSADRQAFLIDTHGPLSFFSGNYWTNLVRRLSSLSLGPPLVGVALIAGLVSAFPSIRERSRRSIHAWIVPLSLLLGILVSFLLWGRLRFAAERFLAPAFAASCVLAAYSMAHLSRTYGRRAHLASVVILAGLAFFYWPAQLSAMRQLGYWEVAAGSVSARQFLRQPQILGPTADLFEAANNLPQGSRILSISEARRYYFRGRITLASVFDRNPIRDLFSGGEVTAESLRSELLRLGYTHLLVNEFEMARLLSFHPPPILMNDAGFMKLRAADDKAALAEQFAGYAEFGVEPLNANEREVYRSFLRASRAKASFIWPNRATYPAMWIAPL